MATLLIWKGLESLAPVRDALALHQRADVELPAKYHEAIVSTLGGPPPSPGELFAAHGNHELVGRLSRIEGLSDLARLATVVSEFHAEVRVTSPIPTISIDVPISRRPA